MTHLCFCTSAGWNFLNRVYCCGGFFYRRVAVIIIVVVVDWRLLIGVISVLVDALCNYSLYPSCHRSFFFFLRRWDVIFTPVEDANMFMTAFQFAPLDFHSAGFYARRAQAIEVSQAFKRARRYLPREGLF